MEPQVNSNPIYLDNASTTKIDEKVLEVMKPYLFEQYGNPGTIYKIGRDAAEAVAVARQHAANLIHASPEQIVFTSGGTEANNLAIQGIAQYLEKINKRHILISEIEHDSVIHSAERLTKHGFYVSKCKPQHCKVKAEVVQKWLDEDRDIGFVSVMHTNNETGLMNDVEEIADVCHQHSVLFHTDCVQAAGCSDIDVRRLKCNFLSVSSHKIHGPKGVGFLYGDKLQYLTPLISGGNNQEFGLRGGTENVAGIVGFGEACRLAAEYISKSKDYTKELVLRFVTLLGTYLSATTYGTPAVNCVGYGAGDLSKTVSLRFNGVDAETLVLLLDSMGVYVSAGSACRSQESEPSRVLTSIGLTPSEARNSIRVSVSRFTTQEEIEKAAAIMAKAVLVLLEKSTD